MMRWLLILLCAFSFSSCAKIRYMDEALRLKAYSDETDARDAMITRRQAAMKEIFERIAIGDLLADLRTSRDLLSRLEEPVLVEAAGQDGLERWLYRDPVKYFDTPKVYFLVDQDGRVTGWTCIGIMPRYDITTR